MFAIIENFVLDYCALHIILEELKQASESTMGIRKWE